MIGKLIEVMESRIFATPARKAVLDPFAVRIRGNRGAMQPGHSLFGSLIWVVGCAGSGKSEASHAFQKKAAMAGIRSVTIDHSREFSLRWNDLTHLDFALDGDVSDHENRSIASAIRQGAIQTLVTVPILIKSDDTVFDALFIEIGAWIDSWEHEPLVVVIRESHFLLALRPDLVRPLAEKIARTGGKLLIEVDDCSETVSQLFQQGDDILLGRSADASLLDIPEKMVKEVQSLREGEFFHKRLDGWVPVEPPYIAP